ncbi:2-phosphosulfolactate phosphatase [Desulfocucumis palustris]|uniref:Probable 2-phosphosulfolactate phosphatase n=1 Tax=Desulfocucumis palustris TaxID=1898651 RepID=A0A2L2X8E4_9FIRM|nr:2-phosphosulfolactate phosphatase [Desulfocucumis palustris]GBF32272.1 2-phosphosulfolactate phosphatase [Desulfocucumis palustris]
MLIEVIAAAKHIPDHDLTGKTAVVFDVLRATSTITTALANGCLGIFPVVSVEEARSLAAEPQKKINNAHPGIMLLAGERGGQKIPFFPHGNSPLEYTPQVVTGNYLVLTTSNGTRAISGAARASDIFIAGMLNAKATALAAAKKGKDIVLICAGTADKFSLEDTLAAGFVIQELLQLKPSLADSATGALRIAQHYAREPIRAFYDSRHGQKLLRLGLEEDIKWCARLNMYDFTSRYKDGKIELYR